MKVSYFPGCTLKNKAKDLDLYTYRSAEALGVTLEEIENWQCCGGVFTTATNEVATKLSSVRALKEAKDKNQPLVTVCSACHNVIKQTNHAMQTNKAFADKVNRYMAGDDAYAGETEVYHYLELLRDVVFCLPRCVSTEERPIYSWDREPRKLPVGWINERINTSDWEGARRIGQVFYGSCWCETSLMLSFAELFFDETIASALLDE